MGVFSKLLCQTHVYVYIVIHKVLECLLASESHCHTYFMWWEFLCYFKQFKNSDVISFPNLIFGFMSSYHSLFLDKLGSKSVGTLSCHHLKLGQSISVLSYVCIEVSSGSTKLWSDVESTGKDHYRPIYLGFYLGFGPLLEGIVFNELLAFNSLTDKFDVNIRLSGILYSQVNMTNIKNLLRKKY